MPNNRTDIPVSTYVPLEAPKFESQIPEHLLSSASEHEKYILSQMSIFSQYVHWSSDALVKTHMEVRKTNGRLIRAENNISELQEDKRFLGRGWKFLVAAAGVIGGIISAIAWIIQTVVRLSGGG